MCWYQFCAYLSQFWEICNQGYLEKYVCRQYICLITQNLNEKHRIFLIIFCLLIIQFNFVTLVVIVYVTCLEITKGNVNRTAVTTKFIIFTVRSNDSSSRIIIINYNIVQRVISFVVRGQNIFAISSEYFNWKYLKSRKFWISMNNNKVNSIETVRIVIAHFLPRTDLENLMCNTLF